jgi:hypothetical protein
MRRATLVIGALVAVLVAVLAGMWFTKWRDPGCLATTADMCLVESNGPCVYDALFGSEKLGTVPMNAAGRASLVALIGEVEGVPAVGEAFDMVRVGRALTDAELMGVAQALYSGADTKTRATMTVMRLSAPSVPNGGLIAFFTREGRDGRTAAILIAEGVVYTTVLPTALVRARPDLNSDGFCSKAAR